MSSDLKFADEHIENNNNDDVTISGQGRQDSFTRDEKGGTTVEERTIVRSELAETLLKEKPVFWTGHMVKLILILIPAYLCSTTNGFDSNTFGGASALPIFISTFDLTKGNTQGLLASMYVVGNIAGSFVAGQIADRWGRRFGMGLGSVICMVGAILQVVARSGHLLIAGRCILGLGAIIGQTAAPAYVVEFAHPAYRGILTGFYQAMFFSGTILSTFILFGLSYVPGNKDFTWQVPMSLQALPSVFVLAFVWLIPESPRWYMSRGRQDRALELLTKYHGGGNSQSQIVQLEMREMREAIMEDGADKRWWDFRGLVRTRGDRHRFFLVACIAFFGQWDLPPTSYYFPLMVEAAGVTGTHTVLLLNALQTPIMMVSALCGLRFVERWGRRPTLMLSSTGMTLSVVMITICTALTPTHPKAGAAGIAFLYIFLVVFAFVWTPMQALYPSECLAYNSRAKGLAAMGLLINIANFFNTYVPPVAIRNVGWRFYLFYACWDALGVVTIYFTFVETKGRNLEEIEQIFASPHPVKASLEKTKAAVRYDGDTKVAVSDEL